MEAGLHRIWTSLRADLAQLLYRGFHCRTNGVVSQIGDDLQGGQQRPRLVGRQTHRPWQGISIGDGDGAVGVDGVHVNVDEVVWHPTGQTNHP